MKEIIAVEREHLMKYLVDCPEDAWTKEGWDKLFKKLKTVFICAEPIQTKEGTKSDNK